MAGTLDVVVRFLTDTSSVKDAETKIKGSSGSLAKWGKAAAGALGGVFAVNQISGWIDSAQEAQRVSAALAKVFENAGDASGTWAASAEKLADSMQRKTGIDDETIKGAQTILATFKPLAATAGDTGGAFERATKASADLAKSGFGDVSSASKQLLKALSDPEKGLGGLAKAGVKFTDVEKDQIKAMVAAGDQAGAYNVILGKIEGKVGGVAEKSATAGDKMAVAWDEAQESLGRAFLPALEAVAPVLEKVAGFIADNASFLIPLAGAVAAVTAAVWLFNAALAANPIILITIAIAGLVAGLVYAYQNVETFRDIVDTSFAAVREFAAGVVEGFQMVLDGVVALYNWVSSTFQAIGVWLAGPFGAAWTVIQPIAGWIIDAFQTVVDYASGPFQAIADKIAGPFQSAFGVIRDAFNGLMSLLGIDTGENNPQRYVSPRVGPSLSGPGNFLGPRVGPSLSGPGMFQGPTQGPSLAGAGLIGPIYIPKSRAHADGGIFTSPTLGLIAEAGPEAVVPLDRLPAGDVYNVTVYTTGLGADAPSIQTAVVAALRGHADRNGPLPADIVGR